MSTIRIARRNRFTSIDRRSINDTRLSFKAIGLLLWLLDKPDDWRVDSEAISRGHKEGRDAIRSALRELETYGYLHRSKSQDEAGRWTSEAVIYEVPPETGKPSSVDAAAGEPESGEPTQVEPPEESQAVITSTEDRSLSQTTVTDHCEPTSLSLVTPTPSALIPNDQQVFDAWIAAARRTGRTDFSAKRRRAVRAALKIYPLDEVLDAVRGWLFSEFHCGQNDTRTVHNELTLLLRDAEHIEMFRDLARNSRPAPGRRTPQSWDAIAQAVQDRQRAQGVG